MEKTEWIIKGSKGKPISLDITYRKNSYPKSVILFCHGFKGFKNWGHFDMIAQHAAEAGFIFVKFNFSYNGTTPEQLTQFVDLDAFGNNNFSIELNDLGLVIDHVEANAVELGADVTKIYLIGHSRGGGIAILKANEDKRVKKIATWAGIKNLEDFFLQQNIQQWKEDGAIFTFNSRTQQNMPLHYQLYENYLDNKERLNIEQAAHNIGIPWLIAHGTGDGSVPYHFAEQLHAWNIYSKLFSIENADHTFGGKHPWTAETLPEHSRILLNKTISFLLE